jgi:hypothetical protein
MLHLFDTRDLNGRKLGFRVPFVSVFAYRGGENVSTVQGFMVLL